MTKVMKGKLKKRSKLPKKYLKNGKTENDLDNLNIISNEHKTYFRFKRKTCSTNE